MTLVSHRHKFIFLKTFKTASSSVEGLLEKYCTPDPLDETALRRAGHFSDAGIIAARGGTQFRDDTGWRGHMRASEVREKLGQDTWNRYVKIHTTRNLYARQVSNFGARNPEVMSRDVSRKMRIEAFRAWLPVRHLETMDCVQVYMLDGAPVSDHVIRFEHLERDLRALADDLKLPDFNLSDLPHWRNRPKRNARLGDPRDYYDANTLAFLNDRYAWEIDRFGWRLEDATLVPPMEAVG
ncbi:MAG: hypothetical protein AAFP16_10410 [Pseudomonadota bacterium]